MNKVSQENLKQLFHYFCFILLLIAIIHKGSFAFAATYYMSTTGSNSNSGSSSAPWQTIAYSMQNMSGGDTLIIKSGTYTGGSNQINFYAGQVPPVGSPSEYTTIKAENDGEVVFNGQGLNDMFYIVNSGARYWQFEGIIWTGSPSGPHVVRDASYIKFLRCGVYDAPNGNYATFSCSRASYILYDGCYSYGSGRYKFMAYHSDHIIYRACVGRPDAINAGGEPAAVFSVYASTYVKIQNCIAVDADQTAYWTNIGDRQGSFYVPCTDGVSQYVDFDQSIGLNVKLGGIQTMRNTDSTDVNFRNMVIWDSVDNSTIFNMIRGSRNTVNHCTFGYGGATTTNVWYWDGSNGTLTNNIFYHMLSTGVMFGAAPSTQDYNCYYANSNNTGRAGTHDLTSSDPTSDSLLYLPRIESTGSLHNAGSSGDIGANCMTLIGTSGTLWGETGYAADTGISMWPFPNEALIKTKMAAYSNGGVIGARGFCTGKSVDGTSQTLTKYIWEYLGNQIPTDIYASNSIDNSTGADTTNEIDAPINLRVEH